MRNYFNNKSKDKKHTNEKMLIHTFGKKGSKIKKKKVLASLVIVAAGILTGYFMSGKYLGDSTGLVPSSNISRKAVNVVGSADIETFSDSAEGELEKGGIDGEGTHKLIRPGGPSQTVYLTSSVLDMDEFVGKKVKVWGETYSSQKAGWFMDVGRVEVLVK